MVILWMDEILHHLRNPGMIRFPCKYQRTFWFPPWFHFVVREADFTSIHSIGIGIPWLRKALQPVRASFAGPFEAKPSQFGGFPFPRSGNWCPTSLTLSFLVGRVPNPSQNHKAGKTHRVPTSNLSNLEDLGFGFGPFFSWRLF